MVKHIPIVDTLNIIKNNAINYVINDDQFTMKTAVPQDKFLDLVNLVLTTTWYTFNFQFCQQTDGLAMGGPASSITWKMYVQAHERTAISTALHPPKAWEGFADDVYFIPIWNVHTLKTFSITSTISIKTYIQFNTYLYFFE